MRISDWSSDVCSSDLAPVRAKQAAQGHIGQIRLAYNGPGGSYAVVHLARRLRAEHPSIQLDLVGPMYSGEEIGRASCRERGCQYVEISVVDVTLKKKNTHQSESKKYNNKRALY